MLREGFIFILLICVAMACKPAQKLNKVSTDQLYQFPVDWIGLYQGKLHLLGTGQGDTTYVDMELIIASPDALGLYPWVLKYNDKDVRYYGIEVLDADAGHYLIDERNSIRLDAFLRGNHFISKFSVYQSLCQQVRSPFCDRR